jgi:hypothetical protein
MSSFDDGSRTNPRDLPSVTVEQQAVSAGHRLTGVAQRDPARSSAQNFWPTDRSLGPGPLVAISVDLGDDPDLDQLLTETSR